jgi:hypothetical protein
MMARNFNTFFQDAVTTTARDAEYPGTPLTDPPGDGTYADPYLGCNRAGSNAPGIGINTGFVDPKLDDWTVLDQAGDARSPQNSQHIGGDGLGAGNQAVEPIRTVNGADVNNTMSFSVADTAAVADAIYDTATGALNRTGATVAIGDRIWGDIPVV